MAKFAITQTLVVKQTVIVEAEDEDEAREQFLDGVVAIVSDKQTVEDSYGLEVYEAD